MKLKHLICLSLAMLIIAVPDMSAGKDRKKSKKEAEKTEAAKPAPKKQTPYEKLMKDALESAKGETISLHHMKKDKIYLEMPKSLLGRKMLVGGAISSLSDPANVNIGYKYNTPMCFEVNLLDSLVMLTTPNLSGTTRDTTLRKALERNYTPQVYKVLPRTIGKDSTTVLFEVTSIVNSFIPKGTGFAQPKTSGEGKVTWLGGMKAFRDNASVVINTNLDFTRSVLGFKIPTGSGSVSVTVSFMVLPEEGMKPRIQDTRVGVFSSGGANGNPRYELTTEQDGLRPYRLANRWRIEPTDVDAWLAGQPVTVKNPIVWYVDDSFPEEWKEPIRKGVLRWNLAFEAIGLKDVMQVRDFPTAAEDPEFDPDNLRYSCVRYVPNATMNAMGPSWVDPETGEILCASVLVYNDVIRLIRDWRFVQTAQVDERVRTGRMPKEIVDESLEYVIAHEIGHTLGLMHNMGASAAIPVESLRDPEFTDKYGLTMSIMDYARYNYVAQPEDKGVKLTAPDLGVYDYYAIEWLYKPVPGARDMWEEAAIAERLLDEHDGDPYYRFAMQQVGTGAGAVCDPSAMTEDIGDDPVKAGNYGISNLKYILSHLNEWVDDDAEYKQRGELYVQLCSQYMRYINNVLMQVGGIRFYQVKEGASHLPSEPLAKDVQKAALKWVMAQLRECSWVDDKAVTSHMQATAPYSTKIASNIASALVSRTPGNVALAASLSADPYTLKDYYNDLYAEVFRTSVAGGRLTAAEKTLQRELMMAVTKPLIASRNKTSLAEEEVAVGESDPNIRKAVTITTIDETTAYNWQLATRVMEMAKSRRTNAPADDRAHYEHLYRLAVNSLE